MMYPARRGLDDIVRTLLLTRATYLHGATIISDDLDFNAMDLVLQDLILKF